MLVLQLYQPSLDGRTDDGTAVEAADDRENDEDVIEIAGKKIDHHLAAAAGSEDGVQSG